ncbi:MAG: WbqC family protein [Bacteroidota bacterium]
MTNLVDRYDALLLQLPYLGNIQFYSKFCLGLPIVFEQHENYNKGSYRNRCLIASSNGPLRLSIPLQRGKHERLPIREVRISYRENWPIQHWRTIQAAYGKSPFYDFYAPELETILLKMHDFLFDLNVEVHEFLMECIGLDNSVTFSTQFELEPERQLDFRQVISPKQSHQEDPWFASVPYGQVFEDRLGFLDNLSVLDLLFCYGPESLRLLERSVPVVD